MDRRMRWGLVGWGAAAALVVAGVGCSVPPVRLSKLESAPQGKASAVVFEGTPRLDLVGEYRWRVVQGPVKPGDLEHVVPVVGPDWTPEAGVPLYVTAPSGADFDGWCASLPEAFSGKVVQGRVLYRAKATEGGRPRVRWQGAIEDIEARHGVKAIVGAPVVLWPEPPPATLEDQVIMVLAGLGFVALVGLGMLLVVYMLRQREEVLTESIGRHAGLGKELGLTLRRERGFNRMAGIYAGSVDGLAVELRLQTDRGRTSSMPGSVMAAVAFHFPAPLGLGLRVRSSGLMSALSGALGGESVQTGDARFDEAFAVRAEDGAGAARALGASVRSALVELREASVAGMSVTDEGVFFQMEEPGSAEMAKAFRLGREAALGLRDASVVMKQGGGR